MQGIDFEILDLIFAMVGSGLDIIIWSLIDPANPNSFIMVIYNMFPIVGNNPLPEDTVIILAASVGAIVGYRRWFQ